MSFQAMAQAVKIKIKSTDKIVLIMLANYADPENFNCWPSQKLLADDCGCTVKTIQSALHRLEDAGIISFERRYRGNGSLTSNMYHLNIGDNADGVIQHIEHQSANISHCSTDQSANITLPKANNLRNHNLSTFNLVEKGRKKNITKRKKQISEDWRMNDKAKIIGRDEGYNADEIIFIQKSFINYCMAEAKTYADFDRAFYNWLRSGITKSQINNRRRTNGSSTTKLTLNQTAG
jgi:hypothetical protein